MPTMSDGQIVLTICSGTAPTTMVMTHSGMKHDKSDTGHESKGEQPCAFAGLSAPSLAAADPALGATALLFVQALGIGLLAPLAPAPVPYLRPPLRGPPAAR